MLRDMLPVGPPCATVSRMGLINRNGRWVVRRKVNGKDTWTSTGFRVSGGKTAKNGAQRRMAELYIQDQSGVLGWAPAAVVTFSEWWVTYQAAHGKGKAETTQRRDEGIIRLHALPFFGDMLLGDVKKSDCLRYMEERRGSLLSNDSHVIPKTTSESTVQRERRFLQAVMQEAIEDGLILKNPWRGIERVKDGVKERVLTVEEQVVFLAQLSPEYQRCVRLFLATGIRLEELRGIDHTRDIDWEARLLTVTGKGSKTRQVPLPAVIIPVLREQLAERGRLWTQTPQRIRVVFAGAAVKVNIPLLSPHTFRHTFGTRWLQGGGDIYKLSKVLGHSSVKVTADHYAHLMSADLRAAADLVDLGI